MNISEFVTSTEGLLVAIGGVTLGTAKLIHEVIRLLSWVIKKRNVEITVDHSSKSTTTLRVSINSILLIVISLAFSGTLLGYRWKVLSELPMDVRLTKHAWDTYKKKAYDSSISWANECINEFKLSADREQHKLEEKNVPPPPIGKVPPDEREIIFERGLLNAVATCFYIKGRSLEALGQKQEAIVAHREASRYTYARCWDPKVKIFWSPAEASLDRLQLLEK